MTKFKDMFEKSVWGMSNDNSMVKNYRKGLLSVIADKNDYRVDILDKQGNIKKMGDDFSNLDKFTDYLADEFGMDWRVKDAALLDWLNQI